jgi:CHASE2 domain-containing sensor protein
MTASKSGSDPARALRRVRVAGLAAGLIAALFVAIVGGALRRDLFDLWQRLAPRDLRDTQVVVIAIDNESLARFGGWPWSRYHVARLTEGIAARRPLAIGYDIIFAEKDPLAPGVVAGLFPELDPASAQRIRQLRSNDDLLGQAMGRAQVVLARAGTDAGGREPAELTVEAELSGPFPSRTPAYPRAEASIPELEFSARGFGLIASSPDADGVFRKVPLVGKVGTQPFPGLSLELVRVARRLDAIRFGARAAELGDTRIPIDDRGQMFLRFGDFPDASTISAADLVPLPDQPGQSVPSDALRDKIVLIGLTAEGTEDVVPTPLVREMSGVYMHALATDAIMRGGGWLERPRWALPAEWVGGLLLVLLVVYALPRRGPLQLIVPALPLLLFGLSFSPSVRPLCCSIRCRRCCSRRQRQQASGSPVSGKPRASASACAMRS